MEDVTAWHADFNHHLERSYNGDNSDSTQRDPDRRSVLQQRFLRHWRLKRALASVILQFEHPIATFGSEFTPVLIAQLSYPDPESIRCVFDAWWDMDCWQHGELDCLVKLSVIKSIVEQTKRNASVTALRSLAELMRDLCCNEDPLPQEGVYKELIPALKYLIKQTDTEVLYHTALVIDSFVLLGNRQSGLLIDAGILHYLIPLISHSHSDLAFCAMQPVCHFTYGNMEEKQAVWDCGFLNHFPNMLRTGDKCACAWVLSCLSYLAAGNRELHCALLDWGLFSRIRNRADYEDIPALTVGSLMKYDNCREVPSKVNLCLVDCLSNDLSTAREDNSIELHALSKILSSAGGQLEEVKKRLEDGHTMQVVYALQWSVNDDESRLSYHIMEDYFG
ncbi:unnamed protein product [Calicophoron daubneyi]|uniref:Uncharacterized protein n=1 Tax=Calicophoron daubneyi TaxID=300641 RepID=A0AAV2U208_CALDB